MLIFWITRINNQPLSAADTAEEAFRQHNEAMKKFRQVHPSLHIVNARDILMADGNLLAPVQSVELDGHAQN